MYGAAGPYKMYRVGNDTPAYGTPATHTVENAQVSLAAAAARAHNPLSSNEWTFSAQNVVVLLQIQA